MAEPPDPDAPSENPTASRLDPSALRERQPRFTPGNMLADRYRIVALLGRGGMGEVYRAEDVKLGQAVALKFLPRALARDPRRLEQLHHEVRLGRQVSHPNVCRLYDITEWQGDHFATMEYIDGEDLCSLLRRIGRLPHDKAVEIARDLCAGLQAAHNLGIVHRDLKPSNVMIDGHGDARVTDFGLAALAVDEVALKTYAGTPAYMAPEQLTGGPVTQRSDLYSLGLILYEMFTGRRVFHGASLQEMIESHRRSRPQELSSGTRDLEPAVQRVILRCLERKPEDRPRSIQAVIAALPGGDPLQAALDAGETPSPEMVAAAGESGQLQPAAAWGVLIAFLALLPLAGLLSDRTKLYALVRLPLSAEGLVDQARQLLVRLGRTSTAMDRAFTFAPDRDYFRDAARASRTPGFWDGLARVRPAPLRFEYRESPRELIALGPEHRVTLDDPPLTVGGMANLVLDPQGRVVELVVVPPRSQQTGGEEPAPDWAALLRDAGFEPERLKEVAPRWAAPVDSDRKAAWDGAYAGRPGEPVHVEAASYRGRPVWFAVIPPWRKPDASGSVPGASQEVLTAVNIAVVGLALAGALLLARRNLGRGRGDRRGALGTAGLVFVTLLAGRLLRVDHAADVSEEYSLLVSLVAAALFWASAVWLLYIALEPYLRRRWPLTLVSWNRLLMGRGSDPLVGRDLLFGSLAGGVVAHLALLMHLAPGWLGLPGMSPIRLFLTTLGETRHLGYMVMDALQGSIFGALEVAFIVLVMHLALGKRSLAAAGMGVVVALVWSSPGESLPVELAFRVALATIVVLVFTRFGLLATVALFFVQAMLYKAPITVETSAIYFSRSLLVYVLLAALAGYGFFRSLGEGALFARSVLEEV